MANGSGIDPVTVLFGSPGGYPRDCDPRPYCICAGTTPAHPAVAIA